MPWYFLPDDPPELVEALLRRLNVMWFAAHSTRGGPDDDRDAATRLALWKEIVPPTGDAAGWLE